MRRLPGFETIRPPRPSVRDESVALKIATQIVTELNLDEFYWPSSEVAERIWQMQQAIMAGWKMHSLIRKLQQRYGNWCIEDIEDHYHHRVPVIFEEVTRKAIVEWIERYDVNPD